MPRLSILEQCGELPHGGGRVPGVMIVGEGEDFNLSLMNLADDFSPFRKLAPALDDHFVPRLRLLFDALAIPSSRM